MLTEAAFIGNIKRVAGSNGDSSGGQRQTGTTTQVRPIGRKFRDRLLEGLKGGVSAANL